MSRHRSEPPADWPPSSDEGTEYPAMPGYPGYPPADGYLTVPLFGFVVPLLVYLRACTVPAGPGSTRPRR
jgi:hypothetical protein